MKWVLLLTLINISATLSAQDTLRQIKVTEIQKIRPVSTQRLTKQFLTTAQKIELRINQFLDSMVRTADASPSFIQKVRTGISNIFYEFYRAKLFPGTEPEYCFYVQCNAQTMTAKDITDGRLVVITGYALVKPAEFEILRFERLLINKKALQHVSSF